MNSDAEQANSQMVEEGIDGMGDGDEGTGGSRASPLPSPGQFGAEVQAAQAAAVEMEEEARAHAGQPALAFCHCLFHTVLFAGMQIISISSNLSVGLYLGTGNSKADWFVRAGHFKRLYILPLHCRDAKQD